MFVLLSLSLTLNEWMCFLGFSGIQQSFSAHFFANLGPRAGCESERMGEGRGEDLRERMGRQKRLKGKSRITNEFTQQMGV